MSGSSLDRRATFMGTSQGQANSSSTPCAACKLLRRRCAQDCPFSPYFSPHEPQKFACVHKVFGASNVSKMLMEVPESQRADAASSLVYEAKARLRDPVYGCMGAISALQQQAQSLQTELNAVRREIMRYKNYDNNITVADAPAATASAMMVRRSAGTGSLFEQPPAFSSREQLQRFARIDQGVDESTAPGAILSCTQDLLTVEPEELELFDEFSTFHASSYDRAQKLQQLVDMAASGNPHFF